MAEEDTSKEDVSKEDTDSIETQSPRTPKTPDDNSEATKKEEASEENPPNAPQKKRKIISLLEPLGCQSAKKLRYIQLAQKCAWCGKYIWCVDETAIYNGPDDRYSLWMVHAACNT